MRIKLYEEFSVEESFFEMSGEEFYDRDDYYKEITEDEYTSIYYNNTGLDLDSYQDNKESFNLVEVKWLGDNLNIRSFNAIS